MGDIIGLIHLIASCFALVFGSLSLVLRKGTKQHKIIGYLYVISMALLIITAFMIYRLFHRWGIFHYATILSLIGIALGMVPIWTKKPVNKWQFMHFRFMYWSVIGLYSAFFAEVLTRIPKSPFFGMVGIAITVVMLIGGVVFAKNKKRWQKIFDV